MINYVRSQSIKEQEKHIESFWEKNFEKKLKEVKWLNIEQKCATVCQSEIN